MSATEEQIGSLNRIAVGVMFANGAASSEPDHSVELTVAPEQLGFESLWAVQHVVIPIGHDSRYPYASSGTIPRGASVAIADPLVWLGFAAAVTSRIRLATGVLVLPQQHALVVTKQAATLDRLSRGRLILGVGTGWLREEFDALGAPFDDRGRRLDEQIAVLRGAWSERELAHDGPSMSFGAVAVEPKPVRGSIPVVVGGHTPVAASRAGRLGDGFFPLGARGDDLATIVARARDAAARVGRDPSTLEVTADAPRRPEQIEMLAQLGVGRVLVNAPAVPTDELRDALAAALASVRAALADGAAMEVA